MATNSTPIDGAGADRDEVIDVLNDLIETCKDGEKGFRDAAGGVSDANLKRLFTSYSQQRAEFATELQREVQRLGGKPSTGGDAAGALHRGWLNLKDALTGNDDGAIVSECERGEDVAKRKYSEALEKNLPVEVRNLVNRQAIQVKETHDHVRSLERQFSGKR